MREETTRLALLPLPDFVLFPHTDLQLEMGAKDRHQIEEVLRRHQRAGRPIGTALLRPHWAPSDDGSEIFPAGTAGRLAGFEPLDDGGCRLRLRGEFRFEVARELGAGPLREALVHPLREPFCSDVDPAVMRLRERLEQTLGALARDLGPQVPPGSDLLGALDDELGFEVFVNRLASVLDLSPLRKLTLLADGLPERARNLLAILRSRRTMLDLLRPFRHLAAKASDN